jgi:polysaccharide deacetylase family protein (PEP-CTERM system associated)
MPLTLTFDLEDNRRSDAQEPRFVEMSHRFLEFVERSGAKATVFVVGELARSHPQLIQRVVKGGHELALHGMRHVALADVGRERLGAELREGRELLEQIGQVEVSGFRAPIFSLTPATSWAVEEVTLAGFKYSSSVLPARNPLHGWPGAPKSAFRWSTGLVELPCPVGGIARAQIPFLGGIYLRLVPELLTRRLQRRLAPATVQWSYVHPYDIDPEEPFFVMPHAGWLTSRIVHTRRAATLGRLERVIAAADGPGFTLGEIAQGLSDAELPLLGCER